MKASHLQLNSSFIEELRFTTLEDYELDPDNPDPTLAPSDLQVEVQGATNTEDELHRFYKLKISLSKNSKIPYTFQITMVGFFRINPDLATDQRDLVADVNAQAILYSAARESLVMITGRGLYPAISLPSVTFIDNHRSTEEVDDAVKKPGKNVTGAPATTKTRKRSNKS